MKADSKKRPGRGPANKGKPQSTSQASIVTTSQAFECPHFSILATFQSARTIAITGHNSLTHADLPRSVLSAHSTFLTESSTDQPHSPSKSLHIRWPPSSGCHYRSVQDEVSIHRDCKKAPSYFVLRCARTTSATPRCACGFPLIVDALIPVAYKLRRTYPKQHAPAVLRAGFAVLSLLAASNLHICWI